ncbi:MAG TPA: hypothetical protein VGR10_01060 [Thermoleophilaceae bacterium]|nr:hypothetical protein [Thermoleophilaceae bacterium]
METEFLRRRREEARRQVRRRRLIVALAAVGGLAALGGIPYLDQESGTRAGSDPGAEASGATAEAAREPEPPPQLPRGGRRLFPDYRIVAFYGAPQTEELGALGIGGPSEAVGELRKQAAPYRRGKRPIMPALELIATIANADPGDDGQYRTRQTDATIRRYLTAARKARALLILDVQPGRADFVDEVRALRKWLGKPDVGLALDPEWSMAEGEVPGQSIGSIDAKTINAVSGYLAKLVADRNLPEKLLILHRFTEDMVERENAIVDRPGVAIVENVDGFGGRAIKRQKYRGFARDRDSLDEGFKLFYSEDTNLMGPRQVLRLNPAPDLVVYE